MNYIKLLFSGQKQTTDNMASANQFTDNGTAQMPRRPGYNPTAGVIIS